MIVLSESWMLPRMAPFEAPGMAFETSPSHYTICFYSRLYLGKERLVTPRGSCPKVARFAKPRLENPLQGWVPYNDTMGYSARNVEHSNGTLRKLQNFVCFNILIDME